MYRHTSSYLLWLIFLRGRELPSAHAWNMHLVMYHVCYGFTSSKH